MAAEAMQLSENCFGAAIMLFINKIQLLQTEDSGDFPL
jgi:hypothetical protein